MSPAPPQVGTSSMPAALPVTSAMPVTSQAPRPQQIQPAVPTELRPQRPVMNQVCYDVISIKYVTIKDKKMFWFMSLFLLFLVSFLIPNRLTVYLCTLRFAVIAPS